MQVIEQLRNMACNNIYTTMHLGRGVVVNVISNNNHSWVIDR